MRPERVQYTTPDSDFQISASNMRRLGSGGSNKCQHSDRLARGDPGSYNRHHIAAQLARVALADRVWRQSRTAVPMNPAAGIKVKSLSYPRSL